MSVDRIGRYKIDDLLGHGSAGIVFVARDPLIERNVAIKRLRAVLCEGEYRERFLREAQVAGRLNHPNIVTVYDVGEDEASGQPYICMEYIQGTTLQETIASGTRFMYSRIAELGATLAGALDYAHRQGVVHRDVKPANIILTAEGDVKITDFGIARLDFAKLTMSGVLLGTPAYMSPEQIQGDPVDGRSDLYSLGAVLFELLTGRPPFAGRSLPELSSSIVEDPPPDPKAGCPGAPEPLCMAVLRCLSKRPEERFQSGSELALALTRLQLGQDDEDELEATMHGTWSIPRREHKGTLDFLDLDREVHIQWGMELLIGREDPCGIRLDDKAVSRKHGIVNLSYDGARFSDLASSNGSTRNGESVEGTIILNDGDVLGIGGVFQLAVKVRECDEVVESVTIFISGNEYLLTQTGALLGSDPRQVDVVLYDGAVAGQHAKIEIVFDTVVISGMGEVHPVIVNSKPAINAALDDGTTLQVGDTRMVWKTNG
jgi:serine/threonine protein kinase